MSIQVDSHPSNWLMLFGMLPWPKADAYVAFAETDDGKYEKCDGHAKKYADAVPICPSRK